MADNKYANGKIYKLVNTVDNEVYVGSTYNTLACRLSNHKYHAKRPYDKSRLVYKHLNTIGWQNVQIELIETYPCNDRQELEIRERYWIDKLKPTLNKRLPTSITREKDMAHMTQKAKDDLQREVTKLLTELLIIYSVNLPSMIKKHYKTELS
jgi:group I intron endonuclease